MSTQAHMARCVCSTRRTSLVSEPAHAGAHGAANYGISGLALSFAGEMKQESLCCFSGEAESQVPLSRKRDNSSTNHTGALWPGKLEWLI